MLWVMAIYIRGQRSQHQLLFSAQQVMHWTNQAVIHGTVNILLLIYIIEKKRIITGYGTAHVCVPDPHNGYIYMEHHIRNSEIASYL